MAKKKKEAEKVEEEVVVPEEEEELPIFDISNVDDEILEHPLMPVFVAAIDQALFGKGAERHGTVDDFLSQPIFWIGHATGPRGPLFQVMKKAHEAVYCYENGKFDQEEAQRELLGVLNYVAAIIILIGQEGTGMEDFVRPEAYKTTNAIGFELIPAYEEEEEEWEDE